MNTLRETRVSGVPGREGVGGYLRIHKQGGDESQLTKRANFFQVQAAHIFVLEYTEQVDSKFSLAVTL